MIEQLRTLRTAAGDEACRASGIDPDANPATAAMAALMIRAPDVQYFARVLPPDMRGCAFPGRFDREDNSRYAGWGPRPGEGECDYPTGCPEYNGPNCPFGEAIGEAK